MEILVIGGKLQGVEATYLANKAGYYVTLVDKNLRVAAANLCNRFVCADVFEENILTELFSKADFVVPALENETVLEKLIEYSVVTKTPLLFDEKAYGISSSKQKSNYFFKEYGVPYPQGLNDVSDKEEAFILKPIALSGSEGIKCINSKIAAEQFLENNPNYLCQAYLEGPSYSMEVVGNGKTYSYFPITEIIVDDAYDCQRVVAPAKINTEVRRQFNKIAEKIAKGLRITGIFDIEVILHKGKLFVLEIDARLPSQTPISIYHATGINLLDALIKSRQSVQKTMDAKWHKVCILQHLKVVGERIFFQGEHIMGEVGPLKHIHHFMGAEEALTNYKEGKNNWVAELLVTGCDYQEAEGKMERVIDRIYAMLQGKEAIPDDEVI